MILMIFQMPERNIISKIKSIFVNIHNQYDKSSEYINFKSSCSSTVRLIEFKIVLIFRKLNIEDIHFPTKYFNK